MKISRQNALRSVKHQRWILVIVLFSFVLGLPDTGDAQSREPGVKQVVVVTDGRNCPIKIADPFGGRLDEGGYDLDDLPYQKTGLGSLQLEFRCLDVGDTEHIKYAVAAIYDESTRKWKGDIAWLTSAEQRATRTFPVHGVNSAGVGMTRDDTTGEPEKRTRAFAFCLRHPPVVLCGSTPAIASLSFRQNRTGLMPYALAIINSIEFVVAPVDGKSTGPSNPLPSGTTTPAAVPPKTQ